MKEKDKKEKKLFHITFNVYKNLTKNPYEPAKWNCIASFQEADVYAYTEKQAYDHHAYEIARSRFPKLIKKNDIIKIVKFDYEKAFN